MNFHADGLMFASLREALLAEMGVAIREDGGTLGVFSPKKVQPFDSSQSVSVAFFSRLILSFCLSSRFIIHHSYCSFRIALPWNPM